MDSVGKIGLSNKEIIKRGQSNIAKFSNELKAKTKEEKKLQVKPKSQEEIKKEEAEKNGRA